MKIIHLSDLHIGYRDLNNRFACICNNIIYEKKPAKNYVIVITGDIVESATNLSSFEGAQLHISRLEQAGFKVLVVPGNHDYGTGFWGERKYVVQFKEAFFGDKTVQYPKLDIVGDTIFIGLDSMAEEVNWHDRLFAQGELGKEQMNRLERILQYKEVKESKFRVVYLHHHPFDPLFLRELKDSAHLGEVLRQHGPIHALLYGHNHRGKKRNGQWGIPRCYDAGTSTGKGDILGFHRVIDLDRDARSDYEADFHCVY